MPDENPHSLPPQDLPPRSTPLQEPPPQDANAPPRSTLRQEPPPQDPPPRSSPLQESPPQDPPPQGPPPRSPSPHESQTPPGSPPRAIVALEKTKRRRHKAGQPKAKPGKESWVHGTKLKFFGKYKEAWLTASEANTAGEFYTKMARLYVAKYGRHLNDNEDLAVDVEDPPDSVANVVVNERLSEEETAFREQYHKNLRDRIGRWYRAQYGALLKSDKTAFKEMFTGALDGAPPKPQRGQIAHFYSRHYWDSRIKAEFEDQWEAVKRNCARTGVDPPAEISVKTKVIRTCWQNETPAFKANVQAAAEREYQQALVGWKASLADSPTRSAEEIASTLDNAAFYLQPFVDAIAERFGMCASVLLCGPIGRRGGVVGMQSVHSGETKGLAPVKWPTYDRIGFQEVERCMVMFAKECFSDEECRARAVGSSETTQPQPVASGSGTRHGSEEQLDIDMDGNEFPNVILGSRSSADAGGGAGCGAAVAKAPVVEVVRVRVALVEAERQVARAWAAQVEAAEAAEARAAQVEAAEAAEAPVVEAEAEVARAWVAQAEAEAARARVAQAEAEVARARVAQAEAEAAPGPQALVVEVRLWRRDDRSLWTAELARAHAGFSRGKAWGLQWAKCVSAFFDFESAAGYEDGGCQIDTLDRPKVVETWVGRRRDWNATMPLGELGGKNQEGSYVWSWWEWWSAMQPPERVTVGDTLSCPEGADWDNLWRTSGKNGLLQLMGSLLWWGDQVGEGANTDEFTPWEAAVRDVTWVLDKLQEEWKRVGEEEEKAEEEKARAKKKAPKRKRTTKDAGDDESAPARKSARTGEPSARQTRSSNAGGRKTRTSTQKEKGKAAKGMGKGKRGSR
ncbi:hypothetical protein B0H19DRAFT_1249078 [Mycena capillaripes]|nr:hypothetical protein B0H19DRAFT_1249078 [Mycena capillaripes]